MRDVLNGLSIGAVREVDERERKSTVSASFNSFHQDLHAEEGWCTVQGYRCIAASASASVNTTSSLSTVINYGIRNNDLNTLQHSYMLL